MGALQVINDVPEPIDTALRMFQKELMRWLRSDDARLKDFTPLKSWQEVVRQLSAHEQSEKRAASH